MENILGKCQTNRSEKKNFSGNLYSYSSCDDFLSHFFMYTNHVHVSIFHVIDRLRTYKREQE